MSDISLALNAAVQALATNTAIKVDGALDISFLVTNCTAFKLQGSSDNGSTFNDIKNSSTLLGASGTLTASVGYIVTLVRCRFSHLKAIFSGSNPTCMVVRRWIRQSPVVGLDKTKQLTLIDPELGTA